MQFRLQNLAIFSSGSFIFEFDIILLLIVFQNLGSSLRLTILSMMVSVKAFILWFIRPWPQKPTIQSEFVRPRP
jgi:hypothetical protein